jgi:hypothetical protein
VVVVGVDDDDVRTSEAATQEAGFVKTRSPEKSLENGKKASFGGT